MIDLQTILRLLVQALIVFLVSSAVVTFSALIYRYAIKGNHRFKLKHYLIIPTFAAYFYGVFMVTLLRSANTLPANLHLFKSYIEAWNDLSIATAEQIILNIAMLVPLGFLLPLFFDYFKNPWRTFAAGFILTFVIEISQQIFGKGYFDVDDLFSNTLGTVLGWCASMFLLTLFSKQNRNLKNLAKYALVPLAFVAVIVSIGVAYFAKDLGNLPVEYAVKYNTDDLQFELLCELSENRESVGIYKASNMDFIAGDKWAEEFYTSRGYDFNSVTVFHYRNENWYRDNNAHLILNLRNGSYSYKDTNANVYDPEELASAPVASNGSIELTDDMLFIPHADAEREVLVEKLSAFLITVPEEADFTVEGKGQYTFTADRIVYNGGMYHGTLYCEYFADSTVKRIENSLIDYKFYRNYDIISQTEAYEKLLDGKFNPPTGLNDDSTVEVFAVKLDYSLDTKGFIQPVYEFSVRIDGEENKIIITAIA